MNPNTISYTSLIALSVLGVALGGCSSDSREQPIPKPQDSGTTVDTGTQMPVDSGVNMPVDTGVNNPVDTGVNNPPDTGVMPDAGPPPMGECAASAECAAQTNGICVNNTDGVECTAANPDCICVYQCDSNVNVGASTCEVGQGCTGVGPIGNVADGICVPETGGGQQNEACLAQFDPATGQRIADNCETSWDFLCLANAQQPNGVCIRLCDPTRNDVCTALGNYECQEVDPAQPTFGACFEPAQTFTDIGGGCAAPGDCQGNLCSADLGNLCSSDCGGLASCPTDSICVGLQTGGTVCAFECVPGAAGDAACQGRPNAPAASACVDISMGQGVGVCASM